MIEDLQGVLMLARMRNDKVHEYWDEIAPVLIDSFAPHLVLSDVALNNVLASIMRDEMQVWILHEDNEDKTILAIGITQLVCDQATGTKNLLVYALKHYVDVVPMKYWTQGLNILKDFARKESLHNVIAYSTNQAVAKILRNAGASREDLWTLNILGG